MATEAQKLRNKRKREKLKAKRKTGTQLLAEVIMTSEGDKLYQQNVSLLVDIDEGGNLIDDFDPEACLSTLGHYGAITMTDDFVYFTPMQTELFDIKGMKRHGKVDRLPEGVEALGELVLRFPRKNPRLSQLEYMRKIVKYPPPMSVEYFDSESLEKGRLYRDGLSKHQSREDGYLKLNIG